MRLRILHIILLFIGVSAFSQVNISTTVDKTELRVNERLNLTIIFEINGNNFVQESKLMLPDTSKFNVIGTGSDQNTLVDKETQTVINQVIYLIVLEPKKAGTLKIGSAIVKVNGKLYKSEPFDITVKDGPAKAVARNDEVRLNMEVEDSQIYENQPTIAILKAYSKDFNNLRNIGKITLPKQTGVQIQPVSFSRSDVEQDRGTRWSSQVVAVISIMPGRAGKVELKPFSAMYNGDKSEKLVSNSVVLNVKKLPAGAPPNFKKTIGNYSLEIEKLNPDERPEIGKPLNISVKVTGEGNLTAAKFPRLANSPEYTFYRPKIRRKFTRDNEKTRTIAASYIVIPRTAGDISIKTEDFSFFNPEDKKYENLGSRALPVHVATADEISDARSTMERVSDYSNRVLESVNAPAPNDSKLRMKADAKPQAKTLITNYLLMGLFVVILLIAAWFYRNFWRKSLGETVALGSVKESESEIRRNQKFDLQSHISYLRSLVEGDKYGDFFENFEKLESELTTYTSEKYGMNVKEYLAKNHGLQIAEDYRHLQQQLMLEKFSPVHSGFHLAELIDRAEELYTHII